MDVNGPTRFRHRKSPSNDRFLSLFSHAPPGNPNSSSFGGDELDEDDVFWTGDFAENSYKNGHSTSPPSSSSTNNLLVHHKAFNQHDGFGILAALPENEESPNHQNFAHFYRKASGSLSSSSSSSSRMIPVIPKPPQDRLTLPSSVKYRQSAPVNVPVMKAMRSSPDFDEVENEDEEGDGEMLPPHEIVARQSPLLACSVLEGMGRTLKGRDLRQVRNAIWRRTGFLD